MSKTAKCIMVQGTTSDAGKSFLTAGLCRILRQDGLRVAPFKSQNMALNSFITGEGLEMGRAQVMQAEAAGINPSARMNPILLKPTGDTGSQVIINGEVAGVMSAQEYHGYKKKLIPVVLEAYESLAAECDVVVIEGAGSPAEINLRDGDIVNMGLAELVGAPVLLAGDIDRGGVFASLYGTIALLKPDERRRVKGTIINRFRGDPALLRSGLDMLEELTGVPVVGTVPYLTVDIEDEDSLAPRLNRGAVPGALDIAVIRLPRISNFTDFHALDRAEGASVRYVTKAAALGRPGLVIIPGTKSTMDDLRWMRENGLESAIKRLAGAGVPVIGICGGYQMLGRKISDPEGAEGGGELDGMGLLPTETVFEPQKVRSRVTGTVGAVSGVFEGLSGRRFEGYEIHMGRTVIGPGAERFALLRDATGREIIDGAVVGNVMGSYVHGLFDIADFASALLGLVAVREGVEPPTVIDYAAYKEGQYDLLAGALRDSLDMKLIYKIIEEGETRI